MEHLIHYFVRNTVRFKAAFGPPCAAVRCCCLLHLTAQDRGRKHAGGVEYYECVLLFLAQEKLSVQQQYMKMNASG